MVRKEEIVRDACALALHVNEREGIPDAQGRRQMHQFVPSALTCDGNRLVVALLKVFQDHCTVVAPPLSHCSPPRKVCGYKHSRNRSPFKEAHD